MFFTKPQISFDSAYTEPTPRVEPENPASLSEQFGQARKEDDAAHEMLSEYWNIGKVYADHNRKVKELTGVDLPNPSEMTFGYFDEDGPSNKARFYGDLQKYRDDGGAGSQKAFYEQWREKVYRERLEEVAAKHPDKRSQIIPDATFQEQGYAARNLEVKKSEDVWNRSRQTTLDRAAWLAGSVWGSFDDPVNLVTLPFGFGGKAATGARGIAAGFLKAGASNAAIEAGIQPFVQDYADRAGDVSGWAPAANAVGAAFLFGGALDAGVRGVARGMRKGFGYVPVVKDGVVVSYRKVGTPDVRETEIPADVMARAGENDPVAMREVAEKSGLANDPIVKTTLDAMDAEAAMMRKPSETIPDGEHASALQQTLRALDDPEHEPFPVIHENASPERVKGVELDLLEARTELSRINSALATVGQLPEATARQLIDVQGKITERVSELEAQHVSMRKTLMSDDLIRMVDDGSVPREVADVVAGHVEDKAIQGRIAQDLTEMKVGSPDEARNAIGSLLNSPDYRPEVKRPVKPAPGLTKRELDDPYGAEAKAQLAALQAEFGDVLGVKNEADAAPAAEPDFLDAMQAPETPAPKAGPETKVSAALDEAIAFARKILPEGTEVKVAGELEDGAGRALDAAEVNGTIFLYQHALDPKARIGHEGVHVLERRGLLEPKEIKTLAKGARKEGVFSAEQEAIYREAYEGRDNLDGLIAREAAAHQLEARVSADPKVQTIIDKVKAFFERLRNAMEGNGFRNANDVMDAILSGDVAKRQANPEWAQPGGPMYALAQDTDTGQSMFALRDDRLPWGGKRVMVGDDPLTAADAIQRVAWGDLALPKATDLAAAASSVRDGELHILADAFGGDMARAKRWKQLWNQAEHYGNGPLAEKADRERELLSSEAKPGALDEDIELADEPNLAALEAVFRDLEQNPRDIPDILPRHLGDLPLKDKNPTGWTLKEAAAVAVLRKAGEQIRDNGLDGKQISNDLLRKYGSYFRDPVDAQFMVDQLLEFLRPAPLRITAPDAMFALRGNLRDSYGKFRVMAKEAGETLQRDFMDIEEDFARRQHANPAELAAAMESERAKLQVQRAAILNAKRQTEALKDITDFKDIYGRNDPAKGFYYLHESFGAGSAKDLVNAKKDIQDEVEGMMADIIWFARKGAVTGDKRRSWNKGVRTTLENMVREAAGQDTGDKTAKTLANAWGQASEYLRKRFNAAGGDIGKLKNWIMPQYHDPDALLKMGQQKWIDYMMAKGVLDRDAMVNVKTQKPYTDGELRSVLAYTWKNITSDGEFSREIGKSGGKGAKYKQHADHRFIHFKDADAWLKYQKEVGGGDLYAAMIGHISTMSRDIAAMERFGANPELVRQRLKEQILKDAGMGRPNRSMFDELKDKVVELQSTFDAIPTKYESLMNELSKVHGELDAVRSKYAPQLGGKLSKRNVAKVEKLQTELFSIHEQLKEEWGKKTLTPEHQKLAAEISDLMDEMNRIDIYPVMSRDPIQRARRLLKRADELWASFNGTSNVPVNGIIANALSGTRNLISSSALVFAPISAVTDQATHLGARLLIGMPATRQLASFVKGFTPADRQLALHVGIGLDQAANAFQEQARMIGAFNTRGWTGYVTDRSHAYSFLSPMTQASKVAFGLDYMRWMAGLKDTAFDALDEGPQGMLKRGGFTEADWKALQAVQPEIISGNQMLTRKAIKEQAGEDLAEKFMIMFYRERSRAVIEGTLAGRTAIVSDTQPGSIIGEVSRSAAMLKSFPISYAHLILGQLFRSIMDGKYKSAAAYFAAIGIVGTMLGATAKQLKNIAQGRDPEDMTTAKFWGASFMQSGGAGIFGDFIASNVNRQGAGLATTLAGPLADRLGTVRDATVGNVFQYASDEKTNAGREATNLLRQWTPGALAPWYMRTAYDRLIVDALQKQVDPDAYSSFKRKVQSRKKNFGNDFFWAPGQEQASRGPNLSAAFGR